MIRLDDVSFRYRAGKDPALRDVTCHIRPGELVGLLGRSGAGRSTLAATLNGTIPHLVRGDLTGRVRIDGELCLEQRCRRLFPGAILTLDIRHAQEKLWEVGRLFHQEGSAELTRWVEDLEELLYKGHVRTLLRRLEQAMRGVSVPLLHIADAARSPRRHERGGALLRGFE